ncbi:uncharacterized protein N7498_008213 [Penicillium cinerascens]|uniref:Uncharacterized protein n=1 Tax=Penicillium cinerascens TaxID=70096 RepID=A0A9W9JH14_9EURO|nr:uncharacterized protein N7498_008213 [Penicillium cinerascens]KAJ5194775.1 hypothetical protein N7498_008213 [Penicillium cinerascens]
MARIKAWRQTPCTRWVAQHYQDHAQQPAIFMTLKETNPEALPVHLPQIAIQVYSTVPLSLDSEDDSEDVYTSICRYLSSQISSYPSETLSYEIYAPQPNVFACVEHQRREILHRKNSIPGEYFFPGIAKVAPNNKNWLLQGFLLVMTSYSFRDTFIPRYEAESGPLWVNCNRSFPLRAKVDLASRIESATTREFNPSIISVDCQVQSEREELIVRKCRHVDNNCRELSSLVIRSGSDDVDDNCRELSSLVIQSGSDVAGHQFDYGLNEDEGDPSLSNQPLAPEMIELLQIQADSLDHNQFDISAPSDGAVAIKSNHIATTAELDLQYIIYIAFPYKQLGLELMPIAKAFTTAIIDSLARGKTVNFEFFSGDQSLAATLASHRDLINSRPEIAIGALHRGSRSFPQKRHEPEIEIPSGREPYRTFFVILDLPDFLTGPGVLFFLTDGNEITDEAMQSRIFGSIDQRGDYAVYQVWRSAGMSEAAGRLAMMPTNLTSWG